MSPRRAGIGFLYPHISAALSNPRTQPVRKPVITHLSCRVFLFRLTLLFLFLASVFLTECNPAIISPLPRGSRPCARPDGGGHVSDTGKTKTKRRLMKKGGSDEEETQGSIIKVADDYEKNKLLIISQQREDVID